MAESAKVIVWSTGRERRAWTSLHRCLLEDRNEVIAFGSSHPWADQKPNGPGPVIPVSCGCLDKTLPTGEATECKI